MRVPENVGWSGHNFVSAELERRAVDNVPIFGLENETRVGLLFQMSSQGYDDEKFGMIDRLAYYGLYAVAKSWVLPEVERLSPDFVVLDRPAGLGSRKYGNAYHFDAILSARLKGLAAADADSIKRAGQLLEGVETFAYLGTTKGRRDFDRLLEASPHFAHAIIDACAGPYVDAGMKVVMDEGGVELPYSFAAHTAKWLRDRYALGGYEPRAIVHSLFSRGSVTALFCEQYYRANSSEGGYTRTDPERWGGSAAAPVHQSANRVVIIPKPGGPSEHVFTTRLAVEFLAKGHDIVIEPHNRFVTVDELKKMADERRKELKG